MSLNWGKIEEGLKKSGIYQDQDGPKINVERLVDVSQKIAQTVFTTPDTEEKNQNKEKTVNEKKTDECIYDEDLYKTIRFKDDMDISEILKFFEHDDPPTSSSSAPSDTQEIVAEEPAKVTASTSSISTPIDIKTEHDEGGGESSSESALNEPSTSSYALAWQKLKQMALSLPFQISNSSMPNKIWAEDSTNEAVSERMSTVSCESSSEQTAANIQLKQAVHESSLKNMTKYEIDQVPLGRSASPIPEAVKVENKTDVSLLIPNGLTPGRAYIINHTRFNYRKLKERTGSSVDIQKLINVLLNFQLNVEFISDGTLEDVRDIMKKISEFDFTSVSCLVIVIMSHGFERNTVAAKDGCYSLDRDIMYPILQNKSLESKLKLVITQACKGSVNPMFFEIDGPRQPPRTIPSEILQINSCTEGYVSYIDDKNGSIFIDTICQHLQNYGKTIDIRSIANKVVADVKKRYSDIQIPMVHSNLTKEYVFGHYLTNYRQEATEADSDFKDIRP